LAVFLNGDTLQSVIWNQAPLSPLLAAVTTANNIAKLLLSAGADVNHCVCGVRAIDRASTPEVIVCLLDVPALDLSKSPFLHSLYGGYVEKHGALLLTFNASGLLWLPTDARGHVV
jgi:hypothetical protein